MRVKNLSNLLFGAKVTSRKPPQPEMTLIVRGTFSLRQGSVVELLEGIPQIVQGPLQAETFREGDDERQGECLYPGDFADFKLHPDLLLRGHCHAPGNRLTRECLVRFAVGEWSKTLRIVGRRVWTEKLIGSAISEPQPFVKMPLDWTESFGGPGYEKNPVGKGIGAGELPTIEDLRHPIVSKNDRPDPVGFGPINPAWVERASKLGKEYGSDYVKTRAPWFSRDFDWTYFNAAPRDQQLDHYLRGDEEISLVNLHPVHSPLTSRLPGLRVRVFVNDEQGHFREVRMRLDTLFIDTDKEHVVLTWRGLTEVREDDLRDVKTVLVASEPLADPPLGELHYRMLLQDFEADPLGLKNLPPEMKARIDEAEAIKAAQENKTPDPSLDPLSAWLKEKLGPLGAEEQAQIQKRLAELIANAPPGVDMRAKLAELVSEKPSKATASAPMAPGSPPRIALREPLQQLREAANQARAKAAEGKATPEELKGLEQIDELLRDPRFKELDPSLDPSGTDEPGPGRNLSGQDLGGRDFRGMDLRGANLTNVILTEANLEGALLEGANLQGAVLFKANFRDAKLTKANLSQCNAASADFSGATLDDTLLEQAYFKEAKLDGAKLRRAHGQLTSFVEATLSGADMRGVRFSQADFEQAVLEDADMTDSEFVRTAFHGCRGARLDASRARLNHTSFMDSMLEGATFTRAWAENSIWTRATLTRADFRLAILRGAHFTEAIADEARFYGADLRAARLYRTSLLRAFFTRANLFGADLCKARLDGAFLTGASLYDAKLVGASIKDCDFHGANLERARFEYA